MTNNNNPTVQQIRRSCKGIGTNVERIINIMCTRTKGQVERIDQVGHFTSPFSSQYRDQYLTPDRIDTVTFVKF